MAIVRTAGTEIIRSAHFKEVDNAEQMLIIGEQHHIYTVLSLVVFVAGIQTAGNYLHVRLRVYDSKAGTALQELKILATPMQLYQTFVWNDKFSFNGAEPVDFAGPLSTAVMQNAIADQAHATPNLQKLSCFSDQAADNFDVHITYIDQNNA